VDLILGAAPKGAPWPFLGGEVQSLATAATGTWGWTAQAPRMVGGAVFGMFTFQADWRHDPWLEFDFEFVGADTTRVRLNIHMETDGGRRVSLEDAHGGPVVVELGFDAARGLHDYEILVSAEAARFRVDGATVGRFGAEDMPGGVWRAGLMRALANLWCVEPALETWAGRWRCPRRSLTAHVAALSYYPTEEP
jgi:beta-glucanase (GH16 family)